MKILNIDKYYYIKGGAERYYFSLAQLLTEHGHQVIPFSQQDEKNVPTPYAQYFPKNRYRFFGSHTVATKLEELIRQEKPDIAHVHLLYHHLTPSVLKVLQQYHIPVVMTVHDYKLICPNYSLFTEGSPCERCKGHKYYQGIVHRCIKNSLAQSTVVVAEMYWHKLFQSYEKNINLFITPSEFSKRTLINFGQDPTKITVVPHFIDLTHTVPNYTVGKYLLYIGRLSAEKGVDKIIEVLYSKKLSERLVIVGTGPMTGTLQQLTKQYGLTEQVEFRGHLEGQELAKVIQESRFVVVPSLVWETFGLVALEAFAYGKAVLAHRVGGLPEIVKHEENGILYDDDADLAGQLIRLLHNPQKIITLGKNGRATVEQFYQPQQHYEAIMAIYQRVLATA